MQRICAVAILLLGAAAAAPASAEFIFRMGSTVYVDGKAYDWEEWKKIRDDPHRLAPAPIQEAAAAPAPKAADNISPSDMPRAASCLSIVYYDEFPSEGERFRCSGALGALTREEILRAGWKIDLIEKIPATAGQPAQSARGLPVYQYKLVISR